MKLTTFTFVPPGGEFEFPGGLCRILSVSWEHKGDLHVVTLVDAEAPITKAVFHIVKEGELVQSRWQYVGSHFHDPHGKVVDRIRHFYIDFPTPARTGGPGL